MDWWGPLGDLMNRIAAAPGLMAVAMLLFIKAAGVPLPIPGDPLVFLVGAQVAAGNVDFGLAWGLLSLATAAGATVAFFVVRHVGRLRVEQYGSRVGLTADRLARVERQIKRGGWSALVIGRALPGFRVATVIVAGLFDVRPLSFVTAAIVGAFLEIGVALLLGALFGEAIAELLARVALPWSLLTSTVLLGLTMVWLGRTRQAGAPARLTAPGAESAGAYAGGLATFAAVLILNILTYVVAPLSGAFGWRNLPDVELPPIGIMVAALFIVGEGVLLGIGYGRWAEPRLPGHTDWQRGLSFSVVVLLLPSVLLLVAVAANDSTVTLVALCVEIVRALVYGVVLGLSFPVFRAPPGDPAADATRSARSTPASAI